jgi:hypothetical protein
MSTVLGSLTGDWGMRTGIPEENLWAPLSQVSLFDYKYDEIALIQTISMRLARNVEPVRHLNAGDAGAIVGLQPAPENPVTADVGGLFLYNDPETGEQILGPNRLNPGKLDTFNSLSSNSSYITIAFLFLHPTSNARSGGFVLGRGLLNNYSLDLNMGGGGGSNLANERISITFSYSKWIDGDELFG